MPVLLVAGNLLSPAFQIASSVANDLVMVDSTLRVERKPLVESEWVECFARLKSKYKIEAQFDATCLVIHSVLGLLGNSDEFFDWAKKTYDYAMPIKKESARFSEMADDSFSQYMRDSSNRFVWFEVSFGNAAHMVVMELFYSICPKTCDNFLALVKNTHKDGPKNVNMHYAKTPIHRIVRDGWIQGGDIVKGKGNGGYSIYGETFPDESFTVKHDQPGIVSMANKGPHTNSSQFFITMRPVPHFDGKYVAFGRVICGMQALVALSHVPTVNQKPVESVTITACDQHIPKVEKPKVVPRQVVNGRKVTVVVCGLESAGKSTIVNNLKGTPADAVLPTRGFQLDTITIDDTDIRFFGLGGGDKIRGYWENYFDEVHGMIFVVDAADHKQMDEAAAALKESVTNPMMAGKPVLVYLNKQDQPGAISSAELSHSWKISEWLRAPFYVANARARVREDHHESPDPRVPEGLTWFLAAVDPLHDDLNARIQKDAEARKQREEEERQKRLARLAELAGDD